MPMSSAVSSSSDEREDSRAGLKAWWASFTGKSKPSPSKRAEGGFPASSSSSLALNKPPSNQAPGNNKVFGVPLRTSLKYASVAISMAGADSQQYVWGYIPAVVAKLGLYLKEHATEVEGVFRIAGSQKRMKELQETFESPPKYGKNVDWSKTSYSVHDAASVFRRYLNRMPEPIVPLHLYSEFRNVMIKKPFDPESAIKTYRLLIQSSPPANQYLLLYVLDLLAVFARKSEKNLMTAANLAVIFQPGMFSHPSHLTSAEEHHIAVQVLEFLIEHQDHFVLGLSPPPPPHVRPEDLTVAARPEPQKEVEPDALIASDSDEDLGELEAHEGGGAIMARKAAKEAEALVLQKAAQKKKHGLFGRGRRSSLTLPEPPMVLQEAQSMNRSHSSQSYNHSAERGTFLEGREIGGPAESGYGGYSPSKSPLPANAEAPLPGSPDIKRSKTTPTKKNRGTGSPDGAEGPGSPRTRRKRKESNKPVPSPKDASSSAAQTPTPPSIATSTSSAEPLPPAAFPTPDAPKEVLEGTQAMSIAEPLLDGKAPAKLFDSTQPMTDNSASVPA